MSLSASLCLAAALFKEARSESTETQIAVAHVIIERKAQSNKSVCSVIAQKGQFSWVENGHIRKPKASTDVDKKALKHALKLSKCVLFKKLRSRKLRGKYLYFNHKRLGKRYRTKAKPVKIGELIFY